MHRHKAIFMHNEDPRHSFLSFFTLKTYLRGKRTLLPITENTKHVAFLMCRHYSVLKWPNDAFFFSLLYSLGHIMPFFQLPVDLAKALLYVNSKKHPKTP